MGKYGNFETPSVLDKLNNMIKRHQLHVQSVYWYRKGLCFYLRTANKKGTGFIKIKLKELYRNETDKDIWQLDINEPVMKMVFVRKMPTGVKQRVW